MSKINDRIHSLMKTLYEAKSRYYMGVPDITDEEYDTLEQELRHLDPSNPFFSIVGSVSSRNKIEHIRPMLSLDKAKSFPEFKMWLNRITKESKDDTIIATPKIDGFSVELRYERITQTDYALKQAVTRGDGKTGEDITHNVMTIKDIPLTISMSDSMHLETRRILVNGNIDRFEVRGEIYMKRSVFKQLIKDGIIPVDSNIRNIAAGSCNQKDTRVTSQRKLSFIPYDIFFYTVSLHDNYVGKLMCLASLFNQQDSIDLWKYSRMYSVEQFNNAPSNIFDSFDADRKGFNFETDGMVIRLNSQHEYEKLAYTSHHPRGAIAYKFPSEVKETTIRDVIYQVSRNGVLTPVAVFDTVELGGAQVSRASLHNMTIIQALNLHEGDTIKVTRSNDVIPYILSNSTPETKERSCDSYYDQSDIRCPSCNTVAQRVKNYDSEMLVCQNKDCPEKIIMRLKHWTEMNKMDGVSIETCRFLYEKCLVRSISNLYNPDIFSGILYTMANSAGFGKKSITVFTDAHRKSMNTTLDKFLAGLGIPLVGLVVAERISNHFKTVEAFDEWLQSFDTSDTIGIGMATVDSIKSWVADEQNAEEYSYLRKALNFITLSKEVVNILDGKSFCVTGTVDIERNELKDLVETLGGVWKTGVSSKLDYLIVGKNVGSKVDKAAELGVKTITFDEFSGMCGTMNKMVGKPDDVAPVEPPKKRIF